MARYRTVIFALFITFTHAAAIEYTLPSKPNVNDIENPWEPLGACVDPYFKIKATHRSDTSTDTLIQPYTISSQGTSLADVEITGSNQSGVTMSDFDVNTSLPPNIAVVSSNFFAPFSPIMKELSPDPDDLEVLDSFDWYYWSSCDFEVTVNWTETEDDGMGGTHTFNHQTKLEESLEFHGKAGTDEVLMKNGTGFNE